MDFSAIWDGMGAIWMAFVQFIQTVSPDAISAIWWLPLGIGLSSLVIQMVRKGRPGWLVVATPLFFWCVSAFIWWMMTWGEGAMASFLSPWRTFFVLVSFVWSITNLVRVILNK